MKKILTVGVFDYLHLGHVKLFERAKACGDYLVVAVQDSEVVGKYKSGCELFYSTEERIYMVSSIKFVDEVITYEAVDDIVKKICFDIFVVGPDQDHEGFQRAKEWCQQNGKMVVVLPRTKGISSTLVKSITTDILPKSIQR